VTGRDADESWKTQLRSDAVDARERAQMMARIFVRLVGGQFSGKQERLEGVNPILNGNG